MSGDRRAKLAVFTVVTVICAGLYPVVLLPLLSASQGGHSREHAQPGFKRGGMWGHIDQRIGHSDKEDQQEGNK